MKKRIAALVSSVLLLAVLLTGCIRTEVGITLHENGSGSVSTSVLIKSDFYNMMKEAGDPFAGKETYTESIDGTEYIGTKETAEYGSAEEIETALLDLSFTGNMAALENRISDTEPPTGDDVVITETPPDVDAAEGAVIFKTAEIIKENGKLRFRAALNPQSSEDVEGLSDGMDMNDAYRLKIVVTMPGKIQSASSGTIAENTVTWEITDITAENEMEVVCETGSGVIPIIVISSILVALIAALIVLLVIRRKKQQ